MPSDILLTGGVAIGATATGWVLNELSSWFRLRREDKIPVGHLLMALAEIRYRITVTSLHLDRMRRTLPLPPEAVPVLRQMIDQLLPGLESLHRRYDEALHLLSGRDPSLAFRLHSKNQAPYLLRNLRKLARFEPLSAAKYDMFEQYLTDKMFTALDEVIADLAKEYGRRTARRYKKHIRK